MKNLLESGPEHFVGPPFSARRILVCTNDRAIDDRADVIDLVLQRPEDRGPVSLPRPVVEAVVDGLPRPEALRQISPRAACLRSVEDGVYEKTIASDGLGSRALPGQDRLQLAPLRIRERVPVHPDL